MLCYQKINHLSSLFFEPCNLFIKFPDVVTLIIGFLTEIAHYLVPVTFGVITAEFILIHFAGIQINFLNLCVIVVRYFPAGPCFKFMSIHRLAYL